MTSGGVARELTSKEADIQKMLAAEVHLGTKNCDFQMEHYVFKRSNDGSYGMPQGSSVYSYEVSLNGLRESPVGNEVFNKTTVFLFWQVIMFHRTCHSLHGPLQSNS
ncbi:hypothetical protein ACET3Z_021989 [Daucus carota]